jgi:hypothetical protein
MYNKSEIMKSAWRKYKNLQSMMLIKYYDENGILHIVTFGDMLKKAWAEAKEVVAAAKRAERAANDPRLATIDEEIFILSMKDRWNTADYETNRLLHEKRNMLIDAA